MAEGDRRFSDVRQGGPGPVRLPRRLRGAPGLHCQEHCRKERHGRGRVHGQAVRPSSSDQYTQRVQQSVLLHALDPRRYGIIERVD